MSKKPAATMSLKAYPGDAKTLLAFNLPNRKSAKNLAGFTIRCKPDGQPDFYIQNMLQFEVPAKHAQDPKEPANSSVNAPIHKFRWLHIPGQVHQGLKPFFGKYTYTVTPRFFDASGALLPLDPAQSVARQVDVKPFTKGGLRLGFTRGFTQSQAFVNHFGLKALIRPKGNELRFDTAQPSGVNANGEKYTFQDEYEWLGFTARQRIFEILDAVVKEKTLRLQVFAYDLNEPDVVNGLLTLAREGRIRIILDNAALHHSAAKPKPEDKFERLFTQAAKNGAAIRRGRFGNFAHDKVFVVSGPAGPLRVLTGSTNFSVTGLYVNSNHVLVFEDATVAAKYADVFETAWNGNVIAAAFRESPLASQTFDVPPANLPPTQITFAPHPQTFATQNLKTIADRVADEGARSGGSVMFAVMQLDVGTGPIFPALRALHTSGDIFSYGISDSPGGIRLYAPGNRTGVLVTGKPVKTKLPPPFNQVPGVGIGHQIHHKFIVCGFNGDDPVVYCGSSNLAQAAEGVNGDNLLAIHDKDVATAFAIEALALVDHFEFLDRSSASAPGAKSKSPPASKTHAALAANWFLSTTDKWVDPYYDPRDLKYVDRTLFG